MKSYQYDNRTFRELEDLAAFERHITIASDKLRDMQMMDEHIKKIEINDALIREKFVPDIHQLLPGEEEELYFRASRLSINQLIPAEIKYRAYLTLRHMRREAERGREHHHKCAWAIRDRNQEALGELCQLLSQEYGFWSRSMRRETHRKQRRPDE